VTETAKLYGFGSYFKDGRSAANDVDLLVLHRNTGAASVEFAIFCKSLLIDLVPGAHIVMLSEEEEREVDFKRQCLPVLIGVLVEGAGWEGVRALVESIHLRL
jgi:hypothetical protein